MQLDFLMPKEKVIARYFTANVPNVFDGNTSRKALCVPILNLFEL